MLGNLLIGVFTRFVSRNDVLIPGSFQMLSRPIPSATNCL